MLRIYIANLGKYNEGELVGKWIDLPCTEEELNKLCCDIKVAHFNKDGEFAPYFEENGIIYEKTAIHDYETDITGLEIGEYDSVERLNELAERLEVYNDCEIEVIEALIETEGYDLEEAMDEYDKGDCGLYAVNSLTELAEQFVDEGYFTTEKLLQYIDFEALGRDLSFDGYTETKNGVLYHYK